MKHLTVLSVSAVFGLAACETMNKPLNGGDFDPLLPPGGATKLTSNQATFRARDLIRAVMDNTPFFNKLPKGEADADKLLMRGTSMKVVRVTSGYLQVELDVTGEIGYVPTVMVESANAQPTGVPTPAPTEYQVYPPPPGTGTLPPLDPAGQPPEGAIPTVIDPSLPNTPVPDPSAVPTPPVVPTPPAPPVPPTVPGKTPEASGVPDPVPPLQPKEKPAETP